MLVPKHPNSIAVMTDSTYPDIEFVYFDLGNILVTFDPMISCENVAKLFSTTVDEANAAVYGSGLEDRYEHGEVSEAEFLAGVAEALGKSPSNVSLQAFIDAIGNMFQPIESMQQIIKQVRDAGYRIGVLSNTCFAHWDWVRRQNWPVMEGPFEVKILSYEIGSMKPDAKIYEAAERQAAVAPEKLLFVDDKQENIDAAIARGWNAGQCFGGESLVAQLKHFGVLK